MFINKNDDGLNNVCGKNIAKFRLELKISQRELADRMQLVGIDIDKNAIQRIECGKRFVTDIEIIAFAKIFNVSFDEILLGWTNENCYCGLYYLITPFTGKRVIPSGVALFLFQKRVRGSKGRWENH